MGEGDELQWHFDQTDFVVSLAIQTADHGGDFEVHPRIRSADDERYDDVARALAGARARRGHPARWSPGTLLVFEGRYSLHRVSPVGGGRPRHVGLLAYDTSPGTMGSELLRENRYGRTEPFAEPPVRLAADPGGGRMEVTVFTTQIGEAFVGSGPEAAHLNTVLGAKGGPVETAWVTALATPGPGHIPFVTTLRPGVPAKPMTLFVNKATLEGETPLRAHLGAGPGRVWPPGCCGRWPTGSSTPTWSTTWC